MRRLPTSEHSEIIALKPQRVPAYNRGSRWDGVLRGIFVAVVYGIFLFFATIALIFPAILLR